MTESQHQESSTIKAVFDDSYWVIPSYNEKSQLGEVVAELLRGGVPAANVIVIDDGSTYGTLVDGTFQHGGVTILRHVVNLGQGAALQTGIDCALQCGASYIISFDADGQHCFGDAVKMLDHLRVRDQLDCLIGSRFLGYAEGLIKSRELTLKLGILFTYFMTGYRFTDVHNGLRVFRSAFFRNFRFMENRMEHASEILEHLARDPAKFEEFPVTIKYSEYSKEKGQSSLNGIKIAFRTVVSKLIKL